MQTEKRDGMRAGRQAKREPRCIYCGSAKDGLAVREDAVIASIRWFNRRILGRYRNYRLVVCKDCYLNYRKARKKYVRKQASYLVVGLLFAGLLVAVSPGNLFAYLFGFAIIAFMYLLSLVSYLPALEAEPQPQSGARQGARDGGNRAKNV